MSLVIKIKVLDLKKTYHIDPQYHNNAPNMSFLSDYHLFSPNIRPTSSFTETNNSYTRLSKNFSKTIIPKYHCLTV